MEDVQEESFSSALLARAKRLAIIGALLLWVASPLLIGAWVTVAVKLADRDHVGALLYTVMLVWALVCLVVLLAGFAMLLGGVFFWWRSRTIGAAGAAPSRRGAGASTGGARAQVLREMQEQLRGDAAGAHEDSSRGDVTQPRRTDDIVHDDSDVPHARR